MFTGIVTDIGTVAQVERRGDLRVTIDTGYDTAAIDLGASIACGGVCLTVVDKAAGRFAVDVSAETVSRTADRWREGARLNLERSLRVGDELGGHIVTGHVDGVGEVVSTAVEGGSLRVEIAAPEALAPFFAAKGSITVDGASLTVNAVADEADGRARFALNLIPHTAGHTTLGTLGVGDRVNLEIDVLARYLRRMDELRGR